MRYCYVEARDVNPGGEGTMVSFGHVFLDADNDEDAYDKGFKLMKTVNSVDPSGHAKGQRLNDYVIPVGWCQVRSWDALLGMRVITGDGREWVVSSITPSRGNESTVVRLLAADKYGAVVIEPLDLPLSVFIGALDFGLIEEV